MEGSMPYKERLKHNKDRVRKKASYKVLNWTAYNQSLKKRGQLSLYFPFGDLRSQFINEASYEKGLSGRHSYYHRGYIELIYLFYRLFGWGMRQIVGYFEDLWKTKGLEIKVPSFGHLSDLFSGLSVETKHFCKETTDRINRGESVNLIMDSTGLSFEKAKDWHKKEHDEWPDQRPWRKLHLSMNEGMEVYEVELTENTTGDKDVMDNLIPPLPINKLIADGGYYDADRAQELFLKGIIPVIPPPSHARQRKDEEKYSWHNQTVKYIEEKGTVYAFHKKYGYGVRSKVEAQFSRIKRCIGSSLKTIRLSSQKAEGVIIANILNRWNSFGKVVTVKV